MKKLFLVCLMMLAGSACAEWVMYFEAKAITNYYDPATIRKDGNMRRVWRVQELKQRTADGEKSRRMRIEYDCKEERYRILSASTHSEPMAEGKALYAENRDNIWKDISPASASEAMFKIVCAK
jgi:hypothetical protein